MESKTIIKSKTSTISLLKSFLNNPIQFIQDNNLENIIKLVKYAADKYYNKNESVMNDSQYDILIDIIKSKDPNNPILNEIGAKVDKNKVKLPFFMGSMDKIKPSDQKILDKFIDSYKGPYIYSDKLDGISGLLYKTNNVLKLYNRGDGYEGTDISNIIPYINFGKIKYDKLLDKMENNMAIRGELIMSKNNFEKYSNEFKNARNFVNGIVSSKKPNKSMLKDVDFVTYEIVNPWLSNQEQQFKNLEKLKINVVNYNNIEQLNFNFLSDLLKHRRYNENNNYVIDGIIVSAINIDKVRTINKNPVYAFAFKDILEDQIADVKVLEVEWNISKDGYIKPTLILEPTDIGGVTISRTTGFNAKFINDNVIGPGSIIKLIRSGDVIPHILSVLKPSKSKEPQMPDIDYDWNETEVDIIATEETVDQQIKELTFFVKNLNIKNLSSQTIKKFIDAGIDTINKILYVSKNDLKKVDGFKETMINKIYDNIQEVTKDLTMLDFMAASNIFGHGIGKRKLKKLLDTYPNILELYIDHNNNELIDMFINVEGFDKITAEYIVNGLDEFIDEFNELESSLRKQLRLSLNKKTKSAVESNKSNKLLDKKIVFSGYRNKDWEKIIESNGGSVSTSVSSNTNILVAKQEDIDNGTNAKIKKAIELGIEILTPEKFEKKYI